MKLISYHRHTCAIPSYSTADVTVTGGTIRASIVGVASPSPPATLSVTVFPFNSSTPALVDPVLASRGGCWVAECWHIVEVWPLNVVVVTDVAAEAVVVDVGNDVVFFLSFLRHHPHNGITCRVSGPHTLPPSSIAQSAWALELKSNIFAREICRVHRMCMRCRLVQRA